MQNEEDGKETMRIEVLASSGMHISSPRSCYNWSTTLTPTLSLEVSLYHQCILIELETLPEFEVWLVLTLK